MGTQNQPMQVGVTGHRAFPDRDQVAAAVDRVLDTIEGVADRVILSSLAEGADRLVAQRALSRSGWRLSVVLPLDRNDYLTDFDGSASREEFTLLLDQASGIATIPTTTSREAAYATAGRTVVDRSDVLIALWDGEPAAGTGGTAEVVAYARRLGRPIAWVQVTNTIRTPSPDTGTPAAVIWERWPWPH